MVGAAAVTRATMAEKNTVDAEEVEEVVVEEAAAIAIT
jgi:hypothetical protein